ncbi:MAG: hypothetical protein MZV49_11255 [Rhodopseudomonas palustris]|nr:hypothetical protein [Rhodopseudomonas palustris]
MRCVRPLTFCVPTGNFGDVFAGFRREKKLGVPVNRLIVATNANDILAMRAIATGTYARGTVHATLSPAMDIQVASNFERLGKLYEAHGCNAATVRALMENFAATGSLTSSLRRWPPCKPRSSPTAQSEDETIATMKPGPSRSRSARRPAHSRGPHRNAQGICGGGCGQQRFRPHIRPSSRKPSKRQTGTSPAATRTHALDPDRARALRETLPNAIGPLRAFIAGAQNGGNQPI